MGPKLSPSAETTFLLVGGALSCCCMQLKNLNDMALIDIPVSNSVAVSTHLFVYCTVHESLQ